MTDGERPHRPAAGSVRPSWGPDGADGWTREQLAERHLDYADELRPARDFARPPLDPVDAAVVGRGGSAVWIQDFRPEWATEPPEGRDIGQLRPRRAKFSRWYPSVRLLVDVRAEDKADFPEQRRRRKMCLQNGVAYAAVDLDWSDGGVETAISYALELRDAHAGR